MVSEISCSQTRSSTTSLIWVIFSCSAAKMSRGKNRTRYWSFDSVSLHITRIWEKWMQPIIVSFHPHTWCHQHHLVFIITIIIPIIWLPVLPCCLCDLPPLFFPPLALARTRARARTSGNSQSVYMYREGGGYLSPSLALSPYHCRAELQGQQRRQSSNSRSVRHRQTHRLTERQAPRLTDRRHRRILMGWIRTEQPGSWWDRTAWLLIFEGGLWYRYVE